MLLVSSAPKSTVFSIDDGEPWAILKSREAGEDPPTLYSIPGAGALGRGPATSPTLWDQLLSHKGLLSRLGSTGGRTVHQPVVERLQSSGGRRLVCCVASVQNETYTPFERGRWNSPLVGFLGEGNCTPCTLEE